MSHSHSSHFPSFKNHQNPNFLGFITHEISIQITKQIPQKYQPSPKQTHRKKHWDTQENWAKTKTKTKSNPQISSPNPNINTFEHRNPSLQIQRPRSLLIGRFRFLNATLAIRVARNQPIKSRDSQFATDGSGAIKAQPRQLKSTLSTWLWLC